MTQAQICRQTSNLAAYGAHGIVKSTVPVPRMPLSVHEKLLEEQAHHFQERLQELATCQASPGYSDNASLVTTLVQLNSPPWHNGAIRFAQESESRESQTQRTAGGSLKSNQIHLDFIKPFILPFIAS